MKILILSALAVVCLAEPPVDNRYLPPSAGGAPSSLYGAPGAPGLRQTDAVFRSRQPSRAGSRRPSSQYGAPQPSNRYGPPQSSIGQYNTPSSTYGAPGQGQAPSTQYGAPSSQYGAPSSQYGAPSQFGGSSQFGAPSSQYGAPSANAPSQQYGAPSQQYGAPGFSGGAGGYSQGSSFGSQAQSRQYLPPGGRGGYGADDGSNGEPANYSFEYMVKDEQSGNDFGHREARQGDRAEGQYYVLLPDGRKQTVQYEADQDGYKPKISYEDTGLGQGGYDRNSQDGYNGYQGQGPY